MMQAIYRQKPIMRIVSMVLICALCLWQAGVMHQNANAIVSEVVVGGGVLAALAGATLLALGLVFTHDSAGQAALQRASQRLLNAACDAVNIIVDGTSAVATKIWELFNCDAKKGKLQYFPRKNDYKWVTPISDDTWREARRFVAEEYDPGEVTDENNILSPGVASDYYNIASGVNLLPITITGYPLIAESKTITETLKIVDNVLVYESVDRNRPESLIYEIRKFADVARIYSIPWNQTIDKMVLGAVSTNGEYLFWEQPPFTITSIKSGTDIIARAVPDVVDDPDYDFENRSTKKRTIAIPVVPSPKVVPVPNPDPDPDPDLDPNPNPDPNPDPDPNPVPVPGVRPDIEIPGVGDFDVDPDKNLEIVTNPNASPDDVKNENQVGEDQDEVSAGNLAGSIWKDLSQGLGTTLNNVLGDTFGWLYDLINGILNLFSGLWEGLGDFFQLFSVTGAFGFMRDFDISEFNLLLKNCWILMPVPVKSLFFMLVSVAVLFGLVKKL